MNTNCLKLCFVNDSGFIYILNGVPTFFGIVAHQLMKLNFLLIDSFKVKNHFSSLYIPKITDSVNHNHDKIKTES